MPKVPFCQGKLFYLNCFVIKHHFVKACPTLLLVKLINTSLALNLIIHMMTFNLMISSVMIPHAQTHL